VRNDRKGASSLDLSGEGWLSPAVSRSASRSTLGGANGHVHGEVHVAVPAFAIKANKIGLMG
jgi:hypothetical protein